MVLPGMYLPDSTTHAGAVLPNDNKQVFGHKPHFLAVPHDFNMREVLPVRTYFILAFHDQDAAVPQNAIRFPGCVTIQVHNRLMILALGLVSAAVVPVMIFKRLVASVCRSARCVHVRRVENDAINLAIAIREIPTVNAILNVGCPKVVFIALDMSPENAFAVGHIGNNASLWNVETENAGENLVVSVRIGAECQVVCCGSVSNNSSGCRLGG